MKPLIRNFLILLLCIIPNSCERTEPPVVNNLTFESVFAGGIQCRASIVDDGGLKIDDYGFSWRSYEGKEFTKDAYNYGINTFQCWIFGLFPHTKYYVKAYARNENGISYSKEKEITTSDYGSFTDSRDGRIYKWVEIGNQIWMAENLSYIPYLSSTPNDTGICVYNYMSNSIDEARLTEEFKTYGCLYGWKIALNACPEGWHLPDDDEWIEMNIAIGMPPEQAKGFEWRGKYFDNFLKETGNEHWKGDDPGSNNCTWFTALPAGFCDFPYFDGLGSVTNFRSSSTSIYNHPRVFGLQSGVDGILRTLCPAKVGCSVRCVKDK